MWVPAGNKKLVFASGCLLPSIVSSVGSKKGAERKGSGHSKNTQSFATSCDY